MDKKVQEVIKRIANTDIAQETEMFGDLVSDIFFCNNRAAAYFDKVNGRMELLLPTNQNEAKKQSYILMLTELLAVLEELKYDRLIYVVEENFGSDCFFYQGKEVYEKDQRPYIYKIALGKFLNIQYEGNATFVENGQETLKGVSLASQVGGPLAIFLTSRILPTKSLIDYVGRGFMTKEEQSTQRSLRYSIISMVIAVFVAAISPLLSVLLSNNIGITTLNQAQMDSLMNKARPVYLMTPINDKNTKGDSSNKRKSKTTNEQYVDKKI